MKPSIAIIEIYFLNLAKIAETTFFLFIAELHFNS